MVNNFVIRFLLVFINLIFLASGIALTIISSSKSTYAEFSTKTLNLPIVPALSLVMGMGIFIIFISLLGMLIGCTAKPFLLTKFGIILIIILLFQFAIASATFVMKKNIVKEFKREMNITFDRAYSNKSDTESATKFFDSIQHDFLCCGVLNSSDYINRNISIPNSCCSKKTNCNINTAYSNGCLAESKSYVEGILITAALVLVVLCAINIIQIIFTFCLVRSLKEYTMV